MAHTVLAAALLLSLASPSAPTTKASADAFDAGAAWSEFDSLLRETYGYLERSDFDVNAHLARVRAAAVAAPDAHALRRVLQAGTWAFTDPHLLVAPLDDDEPNVWPTSGDLAVDAAGVVIDVRADSAADVAGIRPGNVVVAVEGVALADAISRLLWLVPAPTHTQQAYAATIVVNGKRDGQPRHLTLSSATGPKVLTAANPRIFAKVQAQRPPLEVTFAGNTAIVRFANSLGRNETIAAFDAAVATFGTVDAVVIDLRNTPSGGNTDVARAIIGHFVGDVRPYQMHEIPAVLRATTVPRRFIEQVFPRAPQVRVPLFVLGGRWTGSMGEGLLIGLDAAAEATTLTANMGDLLGALSSYSLPTIGGTLELGTETLFHVNGTPRADYVADIPLASADRDAAGADPALLALAAWRAAHTVGSR